MTMEAGAARIQNNIEVTNQLTQRPNTAGQVIRPEIFIVSAQTRESLGIENAPNEEKQKTEAMKLFIEFQSGNKNNGEKITQIYRTLSPENQYHLALYFISHGGKFSEISLLCPGFFENSQNAIRIIKERKGHYIGLNIDLMPHLDPFEIAIMLIENGETQAVINAFIGGPRNDTAFTKLTHEQQMVLAAKIANRWDAAWVKFAPIGGIAKLVKEIAENSEKTHPTRI